MFDPFCLFFSVVIMSRNEAEQQVRRLSQMSYDMRRHFGNVTQEMTAFRGYVADVLAKLDSGVAALEVDVSELPDEPSQFASVSTLCLLYLLGIVGVFLCFLVVSWANDTVRDSWLFSYLCFMFYICYCYSVPVALRGSMSGYECQDWLLVTVAADSGGGHSVAGQTIFVSGARGCFGY
jgi:hypothetical protein